MMCVVMFCCAVVTRRAVLFGPPNDHYILEGRVPIFAPCSTVSTPTFFEDSLTVSRSIGPRVAICASFVAAAGNEEANFLLTSHP